MAKVWLLTSGQYSDYSVGAAFTTRKHAKAAADIANTNGDQYERFRVEDYELYDEVPDLVTQYAIFQDIMDHEATIPEPTVKTKTQYPWSFWDGPPTERPKVRWVRAPIHHNRGGRLEVKGSDRDAVLKAYTDRAARIVAGERGER